jgi:hypothetical protein
VTLLRNIGVALLALVATVPAFATPKRLDLKKLLAQPQQRRQEFVPARAGWDGPEQVVRPNAYMQHMEASTRDLGSEWMALLIPDWRIALLLGAAIIGLRQFRRTTPAPREASYEQPPADTLRAA